ncbi:uncharacterized protein M6B38_127310 [Iris pallida]|uniref:Uncharacterized protein n=1 Tax=Iris pallida TaxID=29817 RepID=A0AAX6G4I8_IRIPA|nr:uncharacterized protein M6B38_127310 [Iris pallida]
MTTTRSRNGISVLTVRYGLRRIRAIVSLVNPTTKGFRSSFFLVILGMLASAGCSPLKELSTICTMDSLWMLDVLIQAFNK